MRINHLPDISRHVIQAISARLKTFNRLQRIFPNKTLMKISLIHFQLFTKWILIRN